MFAEQAVSVFHRAAAFVDLPERLQLADGRQVVFAGVLQEPPGVFRSLRRIAERGERRAAAARFDRLGEEFAQHVDVFAAVGLYEPVGLRTPWSSTIAVLKSWVMRAMPFVPMMSM